MAYIAFLNMDLLRLVEAEVEAEAVQVTVGKLNLHNYPFTQNVGDQPRSYLVSKVCFVSFALEI